MSLADRLWSRTRVTESGCVEFTGHRGPRGYGELGRGARSEGIVRAHRAAWELTHGPIPAELCVLHRCDNPPCINPTHLFLGTRRDNNLDKQRKGRCGAASGECSGQAKLTDRQVAEIRSRYRLGTHPARRSGSSASELALEFGVTKQYIWQLGRELWRV